MSWSDLVVDTCFEINDETHEIRRKGTNRQIGEFIHHSGYFQLHLGNKTWLKHRILALQYIPNPDNLRFVDHINLDKTDNRIENLRWVSRLQNNNNKSNQKFIDTLPNQAIKVMKYQNSEFTDLYYHDDVFYRGNGLNYRIVPKNTNNNKTYFIHVVDTNGKNKCISYSKLHLINI